jgi:hypothetical protein
MNVRPFGESVIATSIAVAIWSLAMIWVAATTGAQHDYNSYLAQWNLVLSGADPWATDNAYGPLHNVLAYLLRFGSLAPKMLIVTSLLVANGLLLWELYRCDVHRPYGLYLLAVPTNFLVVSMAFTYGLNDAFVAALVIFALIARNRGGLSVAGCFLGLAVLLKFYPIILVPMFALDTGRIRSRLILAAATVILAGMTLSALVWGESIFRPVVMAAERGPKILSILSALSSFPFLVGGQDVLDFLLRANLIFVAVIGLLSILIVLKTKMHWLEASVLGLLSVLLTYKVGHQQFYLPWLFLVAALPLAGTRSAGRLAWLCAPQVLFLSAFQWGYAYGTDGYNKVLGIVRQDVGFFAFVLGFATIAVYFLIRKSIESDLSVSIGQGRQISN